MVTRFLADAFSPSDLQPALGKVTFKSNDYNIVLLTKKVVTFYRK